MRIAILPAGGIGLRMAAHQDIVKQLLPLRDGVVIDYPLRAAQECAAWPHIILPRGDIQIARYIASKGISASFSYGKPNLLDSIRSLRLLFSTAQVLYIMADIVFSPIDIGISMLLALDCPFVAGIFRTNECEKFGMCRLGRPQLGDPFPPKGMANIIEVRDKPEVWPYEPIAWALFAWRDQFWDCLEQVQGTNMTEVLARAIEMLGPVPAIWLDSYIDMGAPEDYDRALREGW